MHEENKKNIPLPTDWRTDEHAHFIWANDEHGREFTPLQIRGWGHLTGIGGLHLSDEEAFERQKHIAAFAVKAMGNHERLVDELVFALDCLTEEKDAWKREWYNEEPYSNIAQAIKKAKGESDELL